MTANTPSLGRVVRVYLVLLALLGLTAAAARFAPGSWSTPVSLGFATAKAALIFIWFMRLREQPGLVRLFALAGFFWLAILLGLTCTEVFTRG
jgi:cytochrome c oxidase subunit 4